MYHLLRLCAIGLPLLILAPATVAQEEPINVELVGQWGGWTGSYADVWGTPGYAYVAHFGDAGVHILDISNPANPTVASHYRIPSPSNDASAQDVKVHNGLMFVGLERESSNGVDIVDVRNPAGPRHLTWIAVPGATVIHNVFYDNGYLYLADSRTPRVTIVDLTSYDPNNPPGTITTAKYIVNGVGSSFVHDVTVQDGRLYASAWDSGVWVYDVSNLATQAPRFLGSAPGNNTHSCWITGDNRFVVTGEERSGGGITVFEIIESGPSVNLVQRDQLALAGSRAISVHNQVIVGHRLYNSWYQAGMQVFDIDPNSGQLEFVGSYDTTPASGSGGYDGDWGVYPFLGEDQLLASDMGTGLWVLELSFPALKITFPQGLPNVVPPHENFTIRVKIEDGSETVVPGTEKIFQREGSSGPFTETTLTPLGGGLYDALLTARPCGDPTEYYFSAKGHLGTVVRNPKDAPNTVFSVRVGTLDLLFADNFETDKGWTVQNQSLTEGAWERAVPIGNGGARGDPPTDFDGSGKCYVTGNGRDEDVDGGPTRLLSPILDLSGREPEISYARWFTNNNHDEDRLVVEVSNDNGASWVTVEIVKDPLDHDPEGWVVHTFKVADFVAPTAQVRTRFSVADNPNNSVTEAALDAFSVSEFRCQMCIGDVNGDGKTDGQDLALLLAAWFSAPGDPNWDPRADLNKDNFVGPQDLTLLLADWFCGVE